MVRCRRPILYRLQVAFGGPSRGGRQLLPGKIASEKSATRAWEFWSALEGACQLLPSKIASEKSAKENGTGLLETDAVS